MLNKKIIIVLAIFLVGLFAVSTASAAENLTDDIVGMDDTTDKVVNADNSPQILKENQSEGNSSGIVKENTTLDCKDYEFNYNSNVEYPIVLLDNSTRATTEKALICEFVKDNETVIFDVFQNSNSTFVLNEQLWVLDAGIWNLTALFEGDDNLNPSNATALITVLPANSSVILDDINTTLGREIAFVVNVISENVVNEGNVTFFEGEKIIGSSEVKNGFASITYSPEAAGEYNITAVFDSENYLSSNCSSKLLVDSFTIEVLAENGIVGYNSTFVANVKSLYGIISEGDVIFYLNSEEIANVSFNETISIEHVPAACGNYTLTVCFLDCENSTRFEVFKADSKTDVSDLNASVDSEVIIKAIVTSSNNVTISEGNVTFFEGENLIGSAEVINGTAAIKYTPTASGEYNITAVFSSDNYLESNSSAKLLVDALVMEVSAENGVVGYNITFEANVKGIYSVITEGIITFYVDGEKVGNASVVNGTASIAYLPMTANKHALKAVFSYYEGSKDCENATSFVISKADSEITCGNLTAEYGSVLNLTFNVTSSNNMTINDGNVIFFEGETQLGQSGVTNSTATLTYNPTVIGKHQITGVFVSSNYQSSMIQADLVVLKAKIDLAIDNITDVYFTNPSNFTVNVKVNSNEVKNGTVKYYINGQLIGTSDVLDGQSTYSYVANTTGSYDLKAVYEENDCYVSANASATFNVVKMPTELAIVSITIDDNAKSMKVALKDINGKGVFNQTFYVEAVKEPQEVQLFIGVSDEDGIFDFNISSLSGGVWNISGVYFGSDEYENSTFDGEVIAMILNTTTNICDLNDTKLGHKIKLYADITDQLGSKVSKGIVYFYIDGEEFGYIDLTNNSSGYFNSTENSTDLYLEYLPREVGNHTVTAIYNGTSLYVSSNQTVDFEVVNAAVPLEITLPSFSTAFNSNRNFVATIKDAFGNPVSGIKVTILFSNGKKYTKTTNAKGQVSQTISGFTPVATYNVTVSFKGNSKYENASEVTKITVKKATVTLTAPAKTFKRTVKTKQYTVTFKNNLNKLLKGGKITLKVNGKTFTATTNAKGQAIFRITNLSKRGIFKAVVKYSGSSYYYSKTVETKITVK